MVQKDLELNNTSYDGPVHYFASCAFGWATADTRDEAVRKLVDKFHRDFTTITKNSLKKGIPGAYLWSCQVNAPSTAKYGIEFYMPRGIATEDGLHHHVTYITAKQMSYFTTSSSDFTPSEEK